ncbi:MAG: formate dehydrogenase accessory sulfurtransferase FdhD [Bryobacteraceae bacterium]
MEVTEGSLVRRFSLKRVGNAHSERIVDYVATEEPLEIRATYWFKGSQISDSVAVTMRTPGHDRELAVGFLLSEGVISAREQIIDVWPLGGAPSNEVVVEVSKDVDLEGWRLARNSLIHASCGICGKRTRDAIAQEIPHHVADEMRLEASLILKLPSLLREGQDGFAQTGGLHAAALVSHTGKIEAVFEDIGRHNALDKLIGHSVLSGRIPWRDKLILLSSRSSFELIQKTLMAGAPVLVTVGGPSSLAIETAREHGITLIGFVREGRFNIYSGEWRIHS